MDDDPQQSADSTFKGIEAGIRIMVLDTVKSTLQKAQDGMRTRLS